MSHLAAQQTQLSKHCEDAYRAARYMSYSHSPIISGPGYAAPPARYVDLEAARTIERLSQQLTKANAEMVAAAELIATQTARIRTVEEQLDRLLKERTPAPPPPNQPAEVVHPVIRAINQAARPKYPFGSVIGEADGSYSP